MLETKRLKQHLLDERSRLYCVLDAAFVPDLPARADEAGIPSYSLLKGELSPELAFFAPRLIFLPPVNAFTEWFLASSFHGCRGVLARSSCSWAEACRHFRSLTRAYDESGNSFTFRFYDPRVLRRYLPTCTAEELQLFFGNVDAFFAESEDGAGLLRFTLAQNTLERSILS